MKIKVASNQAWLPEGSHDVKVVNSQLENYTYGDQTLAVTFENEKGVQHLAKMPTVGYVTFLPEADGAKNPDALTDAQRKSGEFAPDVDAEGNIVSRYAIRVANNVNGKLVPCEPTRMESAVKTAAAMQIIGRLFNACGFDANQDVEHTAIIGKELNIILERKQSLQGNYIRLKTFAALQEAEI